MSRKITQFTAMTAGAQQDTWLIPIVNPAAGSTANANLKATLTSLSASATASGIVNQTTQSFAGAKTFTTSATSPLITGTTSVTAGVISTTTGSLILANAGSAFTLTQQTPALAASRIYIWPTADPSAGQAIVGTLAGSTITLSYATVPTGSGTTNQFAFWGSSSALTSTAAVARTATLDLSIVKTVSDSGLQILADGTGTMQQFINAGGNRVTYFNDSGHYYSLTSLTVSGTFINTGLTITIREATFGMNTQEPYMIGGHSDVLGPCFVMRLANSGSALNRFFTCATDGGNYILDCKADGSLIWANQAVIPVAGDALTVALVPTIASNRMDVRTSDWYWDNNFVVGWKDSGGTRRNVLQVDSGNNFNIVGLASAIVSITPGTSGIAQIRNPGGTVNLLATTAAGSIGLETVSGQNITLTATGAGVVTVVGSGILTLGTASSLTGTLTLANSAGATTTSIQAGNAAATRNFILPVVDPTAGQSLVAAAPSGNNIQLSYASQPTISGSNAAFQVAYFTSATDLTSEAAFIYSPSGDFITVTNGYLTGVNGSYGWADSNLFRPVADRVQLRDIVTGTNAQTWEVITTFTSSSAYVASRMTWNATESFITFTGFRAGAGAGADTNFAGCDAVGNNNAGGNTYISAGRATGTGVGGALAFQVGTTSGTPGSAVSAWFTGASMELTGTNMVLNLGGGGSDGQIAFGNSSNSNLGTITPSAFGAARTFTLPDASGTFTLLGNTTTGSGSIVLATAPTMSAVTLTGLTTMSGGQIVAVRVVTAAGAVTVAATDYVVALNKTVGAATVVNLPAGVTGTVFIIKDDKGDAAANNITITPAAGNIDNAATYVIATNNGSATIVYNGTQWDVI